MKRSSFDFTPIDKAFVRTVWRYYKRNGRHDLPWRKTADPYRILVSEIMLQQTQVARVIIKYDAFIRRFPTVYELARAPLSDVLVEWQGLGYNRRAKMLHAAAQTVVGKYSGVFPQDDRELKSLPGVGPYTASAVSAFAYRRATPLIETNLRTVFLHHYTQGESGVPDAVLLTHIARTLQVRDIRAWYYALMDYGSHLKKTISNQNIRSKQYVKQSAFKGSIREMRGAILRVLCQGEETIKGLEKKINTVRTDKRFSDALSALLDEKMVKKTRSSYALYR